MTIRGNIPDENEYQLTATYADQTAVDKFVKRSNIYWKIAVTYKTTKTWMNRW